MSNYLAIAAVTATLRRLVEEAIDGVLSGVYTDVKTVRPGDTGEASLPVAGVNVFLYQAAPNPAWRNADLPTRRSDGSLVQRPQTGLDLRYLFTFHGDDARFEPQRLFGAVIRTMHAEPVLSRHRLRKILTSNSYDYLAHADIAEAVEMVKFSPLSLSLDEMSKLWMMFPQTPYCLSFAYEACVVLIESEAGAQPSLPVRERNLYVVPFRYPAIESVEAANPLEQRIVAGGRVRIKGHELRSSDVRVRFAGIETEPDAADVTDSQIEISLASPPLAVGVLRAGVHAAQVIHPKAMGTPPVIHPGGFESNVAAFVLSPTVISAAQVDARIDVQVDPPVGVKQRVAMLLNSNDLASPDAYTFVLPAQPPRPADTDMLEIPISGVRPGQYFIRVRVDGADSPLDLDPASQHYGPVVTIS